MMPTRYFYDGGANTGQTFEWYLLKGQFAHHHVVCFEPSPRNLSALAVTCRAMRDRFASVRIVPAALGRPGLQRFYEGKTPMGDSLLQVRAGSDVLDIEVLTISLAAYLHNHTVRGDAVTIKLDVEGAEGDVLEDVLESGPLDRIAQVLVEWHGDDSRRAALVDRLAEHQIAVQPWMF